MAHDLSPDRDILPLGEVLSTHPRVADIVDELVLNPVLLVDDIIHRYVRHGQTTAPIPVRVNDPTVRWCRECFLSDAHMDYLARAFHAVVDSWEGSRTGDSFRFAAATARVMTCLDPYRMRSSGETWTTIERIAGALLPFQLSQHVFTPVPDPVGNTGTVLLTIARRQLMSEFDNTRTVAVLARAHRDGVAWRVCGDGSLQVVVRTNLTGLSADIADTQVTVVRLDDELADQAAARLLLDLGDTLDLDEAAAVALATM